MKYGANVKTKTGPDNNRDEFFFLYATPGGTKIGSAKETTLIGSFERTETKLLVDYAYVKLVTPLTYNGKSYQYAYIKQSAVFEYLTKLTSFYVKPAPVISVNVRSSATTASSRNIIGNLKANALIGTTDGTTSNGFFLFTLAKGGTGWVSRNFITSTVPKGAPTPATQPGVPSEPDIVTNPGDDPAGKKAQTTVENAVGTGWLGTIKWIGIALLALALGIGIAKLYERGVTK